MYQKVIFLFLLLNIVLSKNEGYTKDRTFKRRGDIIHERIVRAPDNVTEDLTVKKRKITLHNKVIKTAAQQYEELLRLE